MIDDLRNVVSSELDKQDLGSATFQMRKSVEKMITDFESSITKKLDVNLPSSSKRANNICMKSMATVRYSIRGHLFSWDGKCQRVLDAYVFQLKSGSA